MATLFDTLKNNMNQAAAAPTNAPQASEQNLTGQAQTLLQAKSGKAVAPGSTPRISNVGEQMANMQTGLGQQQLAQQVALGTQQLATQANQQQQQIDLQKKEQQFQSSKVEEDFTRNEDAMMNQYLQGQKQLNLKKDKAKFEQLGFKLRLQDQTYMDNLNREAKKSQLDNGLKFKEEMARTVFSEELDMFQDNLQFRGTMFSDKMSFNEQMSNMDLDYAVQMAQFENKQAAANSLFTGIGGAITGGANMYTAMDKKKSSSDEGTGTESGSSTEGELPSSNTGAV